MKRIETISEILNSLGECVFSHDRYAIHINFNKYDRAYDYGIYDQNGIQCNSGLLESSSDEAVKTTIDSIEKGMVR